jgi:hypothetical protein
MRRYISHGACILGTSEKSVTPYGLFDAVVFLAEALTGDFERDARL